jgi:hypothetical protein
MPWPSGKTALKHWHLCKRCKKLFPCTTVLCPNSNQYECGRKNCRPHKARRW